MKYIPHASDDRQLARLIHRVTAKTVSGCCCWNSWHGLLFSPLQDRTPPFTARGSFERCRKIVYEPPTARRIKTKNLCHAVVIFLCSDGEHDRNAQVAPQKACPVCQVVEIQAAETQDRLVYRCTRCGTTINIAKQKSKNT